MSFHDDFDEPIAGIDLTPIIDVLFLLLIFFVMTTTFTRPVVDIVLPSAESSKSAKRQKQIQITVDRNGYIFFEGEQVAATKTAIDLIMERDIELPVNFLIDSKAPFDIFMLLVDRARIKGRTNFNIITVQEIPSDVGAVLDSP